MITWLACDVYTEFLLVNQLVLIYCRSDLITCCLRVFVYINKSMVLHPLHLESEWVMVAYNVHAYSFLTNKQHVYPSQKSQYSSTTAFYCCICYTLQRQNEQLYFISKRDIAGFAIEYKTYSYSGTCFTG